MVCLSEVTFVDLVTESGKRVTKCIPDTMNVVKCRNLAIRLLGIKGVRCVVSYRAHQVGASVLPAILLCFCLFIFIMSAY